MLHCQLDNESSTSACMVWFSTLCFVPRGGRGGGVGPAAQLSGTTPAIASSGTTSYTRHGDAKRSPRHGGRGPNWAAPSGISPAVYRTTRGPSWRLPPEFIVQYSQVGGTTFVSVVQWHRRQGWSPLRNRTVLLLFFFMFYLSRERVWFLSQLAFLRTPRRYARIVVPERLVKYALVYFFPSQHRILFCRTSVHCSHAGVRPAPSTLFFFKKQGAKFDPTPAMETIVRQPFCAVSSPLRFWSSLTGMYVSLSTTSSHPFRLHCDACRSATVSAPPSGRVVRWGWQILATTFMTHGALRLRNYHTQHRCNTLCVLEYYYS